MNRKTSPSVSQTERAGAGVFSEMYALRRLPKTPPDDGPRLQNRPLNLKSPPNNDGLRKQPRNVANKVSAALKSVGVATNAVAPVTGDAVLKASVSTSHSVCPPTVRHISERDREGKK
ncbi:hypothetical protein DPEC_G00216750 [Dallia pectoralis]|uniref:Uncharacterized protein n=1 Tax=Dallia pectoralis TaxID=75939 RepID=A0ACC2G2M6_DALPE|nr:hypothetical protein DPEC_G00216750 [Dallia pectoralis]